MNHLVKPITCSRCKGKGYVASNVQHGMCFKCLGWGKVEGDKATIAAAKKFTADRIAAYGILAAIPVVGENATERLASMEYNGLVTYGYGLLEEKEPERFRKAVASVLAGHPGVVAALHAYAKEN